MAAFLFSGRREVMIDACLQGMDGLRLWDRRRHGLGSGSLGDFCFLAGKPEERLIAWDYGRQYLLLAPPDAAWRELIKKVLGGPGQGAYPVCHKKRGGLLRPWQAAGPGGDPSCGDHPFPDPWGVIWKMP